MHTARAFVVLSFLTIGPVFEELVVAQNLVKDANFSRYGKLTASKSGRWGTGKYSRRGIAFGKANAALTKLDLRKATTRPGSRPRGCFTALRIVNRSRSAANIYKTTSQRISITKSTGTYWVSLWARTNAAHSVGACAVIVDGAWKLRPIQIPGGPYNWTHLSGRFDLSKVDTAKRGYIDLRIITQDICNIDITGVQLRRATSRRAGLVHVLTLVDTDSNLKSSVESDRRRFVRSLSRVFIGRMTLTQLTGRNATPANVLRYYSRLHVDPNDTLLFFYAGHGGIHRTSGHTFTMKYGHIARSVVIRAMDRKGPRLKVLLTDCCSNLYGKALLAEVPYAPDLRIWHDLLLRPRGTVDITSASPGESAWGQAYGGFFTTDFCNLTTASLSDLDKNRDGVLKWAEMLSKARRSTEGSYRRFRDFALKNPKLPPQVKQLLLKQPKQSPYAFRIKSYRTRSAQLGDEPKFVEGKKLFDKKKYSVALVAFGQAVAGNPTNYRAYNNRGRCFARLKDFPAAIVDFTKSIEINPRYSSAFNNRAIVNQTTGQLARAASDFQTAARYSSKNPDYQRRAAWILATCKRREVRDGASAVRFARKGCRQTNWKDWRQLQTLAAAYAEAGQFKKAVEQIDRALKRAPKSKQTVCRKMRSGFKSGKPYRVN